MNRPSLPLPAFLMAFIFSVIGQVLLADFGLAKRTKAGLFAEEDACGTMVRL